MNINEFIERFKPCSRVAAWLRARDSLEDAWQTCERADWMLWTLHKIGYDDDSVYRLLGCDCG